MKKLTSVVLSILMVISMLSCLFVGSVSAEEANKSVTAAEIYDISGKKIDNEQTYTNVTTAVNGKEVTATVKYDKDSGAYFFLGWYDETGEKVSADEAYTFTPAEGKIYTPRIGSANLLGGSGSFENYGDGENLAVALPTGISSVNDITADNIPNYSGNNKWATNENGGYLGATWPETIYDKDGNNYKQVATYRRIKLHNTFNVVEGATIAKSGSKYLHINGGGASSLGLENLNKNTDYKLSFYLRYSGVNANKIKSVGVTTTVNINNEDYNKNATLKSQGMLITLENAVPSHKITVAKCDSTELSKVSTTEWQKITVDFNSGNLEKLYLAIVSTNGKALDYYIDDMVLVKAGTANSVSADVEFQNANGGAVDSSNEYAKADIIGNFDGTYTATVDYDRDCGAYAFDGWYYDDAIIEGAGETFDFDINTYTDLTKLKAVITSANLLPEAASFEGYKDSTKLTYGVDDATEGVYPAPTSTRWGTSYEGTYFKDNHFQIHTVYGQYEVPCYNKDTNTYVKKSFNAHSGNSMLRINTQSRSAIRALENLTPNTDYQLTFYVMGTSSVDYLNVVAVADRYDGYNLSTATESTEGTIAIKKLTYTEGWQKVQLSFNSGEHTTLYLHLRQQNKTNIDSQGGSFVDDLSLIAMPKVDGISYKGASIRAYATEDKPQALRHKFEIKKSLINDNIALYGKLVEYGSVAIRTDYLGGKELVKDGVYNYQDRERKAVTGIAYKKGTIDKVFADTGDTKIFTAALTGIGKQAGTEELDYSLFAKEYAVRNYLIFRNGTKETIVYTETQSCSVFDVMKAIEDKYAEESPDASSQLAKDYNTLQSVLDGDLNQKTAYETWKNPNQQPQ